MEKLEFKLVRFNPRRAARGVEAAEVEVKDGNKVELLWMSKSDIRMNMKIHGESEGLQAAFNAYKKEN